MEQVVTIGLDIAKSVFQVHGIDAQGAVVVRQRYVNYGAARPSLNARGRGSEAATSRPGRGERLTLGEVAPHQRPRCDRPDWSAPAVLGGGAVFS
jgi:hypothetical protein